MEPDAIFFADFSYLFNWINIPLYCRTHCSIYKHTNISLLFFLHNTLFKLFRNHSPRHIGFYINDVFLSDSTKMGSFFHRIMWGLAGEYFQRLPTVAFGFIRWIEIVPGSCYRHKIGKWSSWSEYPINIFPIQ